MCLVSSFDENATNCILSFLIFFVHKICLIFAKEENEILFCVRSLLRLRVFCCIFHHAVKEIKHKTKKNIVSELRRLSLISIAYYCTRLRKRIGRWEKERRATEWKITIFLTMKMEILLLNTYKRHIFKR